MRIVALAKRILLELSRDVRTLLLVIIVPVIVLSLLKFTFTVNTDVTARVGVINLPEKVEKKISQNDKITVVKMNDWHVAKKELQKQQVAGVITYNARHRQYHATYTNENVARTHLLQETLQKALTQTSIEGMKTKLRTVFLANKRLLPSSQVSLNRNSVQNYYLYGNSSTTYFDTLVPTLLNVFVFLFVFLTSGMALLNERTQGTLARMLATPIRRFEVVGGYILSYGVIAVIQTIVTIFFSLKILDVQIRGNVVTLMIVNIMVAFVALSLGLLLSTMAESQFQMMQFIPLAIVPQFFFCGVVPLTSMPPWVQLIGRIMPLEYSGIASKAVVIAGAHISQIIPELMVLFGFFCVIVMVNVWGLRRYREV